MQNNVGQPRFFVNVLEFLAESGVLVEYQALVATEHEGGGIHYSSHDYGYDMPNVFRTIPGIPSMDECVT